MPFDIEPLDMEPLDIEPLDMEPLDMEPLLPAPLVVVPDDIAPEDIAPAAAFLACIVFLALGFAVVVMVPDDIWPEDIAPDCCPLDIWPDDIAPLVVDWAKAPVATAAPNASERPAILMKLDIVLLLDGAALLAPWLFDTNEISAVTNPEPQKSQEDDGYVPAQTRATTRNTLAAPCSVRTRICPFCLARLVFIHYFGAAAGFVTRPGNFC